MIATLAFLALAASVGFGYLWAADHFRWQQTPPQTGWDGVERRAIRSLPYGIRVSDAQLAAFLAELERERERVPA